MWFDWITAEAQRSPDSGSEVRRHRESVKDHFVCVLLLAMCLSLHASVD